MKAGTVFEESVKVGFWKMKATCTVTDLIPEERFTFKATSNKPIEYLGSFQLRPAGSGTHLTASAEVRLKGLWRLLEPLLGPDFRKETRHELEGLRRAVEGAHRESNRAPA